MKITMTLLTLLVLFLPTSPAQEYTQLSLPEGAVARLGKGSLNVVRYSPDGARLAVAGSSGIWFYDTTTYRAIALLTGNTDNVISVAFSPDGKILATSSKDSTVRVWDAVIGELKRELTGQKGRVDSVAFSPDGKTLLSASYARSIYLWDVVTGQRKQTQPIGMKYTDEHLTFSANGTTLAGGGYGAVSLWDAVTGQRKQRLVMDTKYRDISLALSPDGTTVAGGNKNDTVYLWDAVTGSTETEANHGHET